MDNVEFGDRPPTAAWHAPVIDRLQMRLFEKNWARGLQMRGSVAHDSQDSESDIDLVVTVADGDFRSALQDLFRDFPTSLPGQLTPWLDAIVRDFGGLGLVYLVQVTANKWAQVDIYLLPENRLSRLQSCEFIRPVWQENRAPGLAKDSAEPVDEVRREFQHFAAADLEQAVMACYVALIMLRKRLVRRDSLQVFADIYATAVRFRDLLLLNARDERQFFGWRDVPEAAQKCSNPDLVLDAMACFGRNDLVSPEGLTARISALEKTVALLAPALWRDRGEALRALGRYLVKPPAEH